MVVLIATASATTATGEQADPAPAPAPIIIDVSGSNAAEISAKTAFARRQLRSSIERAIDDDPGLEPSGDLDLAAALYADFITIAFQRGSRAAEAATLAADNDRCADAKASAQIAVLELAAAQTQARAKQLEATERGLRDAYRARFICSLKAGDRAETLDWAKKLRQAGQQGPPHGVSGEVWASNPELDASTNISHARLTVQSDVVGATVFVDHVNRGVTPLTIHVPQGDHVVAVGNRGGLFASAISIRGWTHTEILDERTPRGRWGAVATLVASLQTKKRAADAAAIEEVMTLAGAQAAFVMVGGSAIEAWRKDAQGRATKIGQRHDAKQVVALLSQTSRGSTAPSPSGSLLREDPQKRGNTETKERPTKWWVYAAVLGAAAVGAGIIIVGQSGTDRQRIEISLP